VFKGESHTLVSESLIAFQALYRVIEMTEKNLKTSYADTLLHSFYSVTEFMECKIDMDDI
jgi:hypothetical protein